MNVYALQSALWANGFNPGKIDGIYGPKTEKALIAFKRAHGLQARAYLGDKTRKLLHLVPASEPEKTQEVLPWMNEIGKYVGLHETWDNEVLSTWLKSDGLSIGDPSKIPWCGDAIQTSIKNTLPHEPFPGAVGKNPYLARNWLWFGVPCGISYGAVGVFWRESLKSIKGHVAYLIGLDLENGMLRIRGGNQGNRIQDDWIAIDRLLGCVKPSTYNKSLPTLPRMNSMGLVTSTNEA